MYDYLVNTSNCVGCEYAGACEDYDMVNFCEDCKECPSCDIKTVYCEAGHAIECNNSFEPKSEIDWEDEEDEF